MSRIHPKAPTLLLTLVVAVSCLFVFSSCGGDSRGGDVSGGWLLEPGSTEIAVQRVVLDEKVWALPPYKDDMGLEVRCTIVFFDGQAWLRVGTRNFYGFDYSTADNRLTIVNHDGSELFSTEYGVSGKKLTFYYDDGKTSVFTSSGPFDWKMTGDKTVHVD
ncbi:MAG: hypothetical protein LBN10_08690 [Propionibacteriaceae bacterium]|jgi:hypothetical protein|nr:hypothetical protein [Propionibacteriaceae bacterium]